MAEDVGTLVARVIADTEQFRSEMLKMTRQLETNTAKMNTALARVNTGMASIGAAARTATRLLGTFGIALSVGALVRFAKNAVESADAIGEMAKAAGLGAERFQRLQAVFAENGTEAGNFQAAMNNLNVALGQFIATGGGRAAKAIKELGLQSAILNGEITTSEQLFDAVVERFENIDSAATRAGLAAQLFGREAGAKMADTISHGTEALAAMEASVKGVIGDEQIAQADELDRKMRALSLTVGGALKNAFVSATHAVFDFFGAFGPSMEDLNEQIRLAIMQLESLSELAPAEVRAKVEAELRALQNLRSGGQASGRAFSDFISRSVSDAPAAGMGGLEPISVSGRMRDFEGVGSFGGGVQPIVLNQEMLDEQIKLEEQFQERRTKAAEDAAEIRKRIERDVAREEQGLADERIAIEQQVQDFKMQAAFSAAGFLRALGAEHRGAAIAALAIEKALAIKQVLIQSHVAAAKALATLGPIAGPPVAAKMLAMGRISAGFIAAQGLVEASQLSSGGTQSTLGTSANPLSTTSSGSSSAADTIARNRQSVVQVIFRGDVFGWDDYIQSRVIAGIREAVDGKDVVIIGANSRQAEVLGV